MEPLHEQRPGPTARSQQRDPRTTPGACAASARVRPQFVQNRCYAVAGLGSRRPRVLQANGLIYQGFSLLTANRECLAHPHCVQIARRHRRTRERRSIFRFALDVGMVALTGTTNPDHMRTDLGVFDFHLEPEEVQRIEGISSP